MIMSKINLSSIADIYSIQNNKDVASAIHINTGLLKRAGVLRYAFKYAIWALPIGGELIVQDSPARGFGFSTRFVDFWQIKNELFKVLKDQVEVISLDEATGLIRLRKSRDNYGNTGFTFGIVFSGNDAELNQLQKALDSIAKIRRLNEFDHEVLICGPSQFRHEQLAGNFQKLPIRYLPFDDVLQGKRIMITRKKNALIDAARFNIVSLSHARIMYGQNIAECLSEKKFDALTTKVVFNVDGKQRKYLDFTLSGSYDTSRPNTRSILSHEVLPDDVLRYMAQRVPYIDGGLTILNKNTIGEVRYCPDLAWGEAEDIDLCARLYNDGLLIDYENGCECESQTNKVEYTDSPLRKLKRIVQQALVRHSLA